MKGVRWSQLALLDLENLGEWLKQHSPHAAMRAEQEISDAVLAIAKRPEAWPKSAKLDVHLRSLPKWSRRIAYQIEDDAILIVSIKHTRQNREL